MIKPKKSLGQNFLIDKNIINKIINLASVEENNIIEIGPGTGNLTEKIIEKKPKSLTLIEKDSKLLELLKKKNLNNKKIIFLNEDILKFNLEDNIKKNSIIFGNLPYNISSQILVNLIKFKKWLPEYNKLILMFQKEVAEKIISNFNTSSYGRLTVLTKSRLKITDSFHISKNCFFPKPKVESMVLVFEPIINNEFKVKNIENLEKITHVFFSKKRKMINKGFKSIFKDPDKTANILGIDLKKRPSQLKEKEYFLITKYFEDNI